MKMMAFTKKIVHLLHCFIPILAGISFVTLLWTSQSMYSTAVYYTGYFTSLPVQLAWKFNGNFDLECNNLVANRGPGSISLSFWLDAYLSATQDPSKRAKGDVAEIKCALQHIYHKKEYSLTLLKKILDSRSDFIVNR